MTVWLVTWLWQGLALTALVAVAVRPWPRLNAATRHVIWFGVLVALIWMGGAAWPSGALSGPNPALARAADPGLAETVFRMEAAPAWLLSSILGIWAVMALVELGRLAPGLRRVSSLRARCTPFPSDVEARLPYWLEGTRRGRPAQLMICDAVAGAVVLGFRRPFIALPQSMVSALSIEELDQVVLHEHAHVQRRDDWARMAQAVLQALLWIHPGAAFIGRQLDLERESACDEWVVVRTRSAKRYARCLVRAAELAHADIGGLFVPTFFDGSRHLVRRVDRLLASNGHTRRSVSVLAACTSACALVLVSARLSAVPLIGEKTVMAIPRVPVPSVPVPPPARPEVAPVIALLVEKAPIRQPRLSAAAGLTVQSGGERLPGVEKPDTAYVEKPDTAYNDRLPATIESKTFSGTYDLGRPTPLPTSSRHETPWQKATTAGVRIGQTAQKASAGAADAFTRAGVSLARKF
jgi:beta-lactamase regulating signal transducer with metallopeptidase domain